MLTPEIIQFIKQYGSEDPMRLRLSHGNDAPWAGDAINHIENLPRVRAKFRLSIAERQRYGLDAASSDILIPLWHPHRLAVEQSTGASLALHHRELAMKWERTLGFETHIVLDMTMGLGVDAAAWTLDGRCHVTGIDLDCERAAVARVNWEGRGMTVVNGDSVEFLATDDTIYDLVYIDPARRDSKGGRVYNLHDCSPDVTQILPLVTTHARLVMLKMSPMLDVSQTLRDLDGYKVLELQACGSTTECKEIVAVIMGNAVSDALGFHDVILSAWTPMGHIEYSLNEEHDAKLVIGDINEGEYLYEPWPPVMKMAPFKTLCARYGVKAVGANTHLFTSAELNDGFPGTARRITRVMPFSSSSIKAIAKMGVKGQLTTRNFPIAASTLMTRLKIKPGSDTLIYCVTDHRGEKLIIFTQC